MTRELLASQRQGEIAANRSEPTARRKLVASQNKSAVRRDLATNQRECAGRRKLAANQNKVATGQELVTNQKQELLASQNNSSAR